LNRKNIAYDSRLSRLYTRSLVGTTEPCEHASLAIPMTYRNRT
jgi:hypothetical protein